VNLTFDLLTLNFYGSSIVRAFSGVRGLNFITLGENIGRSFLHNKFVSEFGYLAPFSNAGSLKLGDVENDTQFCTF